MALTYKPKIDPVRRNVCKQTIRTMRKRPITPGDVIKFHGWMDKAYRSPWTSRKAVVVEEVIKCWISKYGVELWDGCKYKIYHWSSDWCKELARRDYISPATGESLRDVLFGLNGAPDEPQEYQIVRW